jgi:hypothetical protein
VKELRDRVCVSVVDAVLANRFWVFPTPEFLPEELPLQTGIRAANARPPAPPDRSSGSP